jgi:fimbrial isopeptide formation D2 family protein
VKKKKMDNRRRNGAAIITKLGVISLLLLTTALVASAGCDHNVTLISTWCNSTTTAGWFYNGTAWNYSASTHTPLFNLSDNTEGANYSGFCINYTVDIFEGDTFNASIYIAEPTCRNNSIAYLLNHWDIFNGSNCDNISAGQSAIWYFSYLNETFCGNGTALYNNTAVPSDPDWESNFIPNCTAHPLACTFIDNSINKSVPYNITLKPSSGDFTGGTPVGLNATVDYCLGLGGGKVTVVFKTDAGTFENGSSSFENDTVDGIAIATLTCNADTAHVTAQIKDRYWFEVVDPIGCQATNYQPTLRIIHVTDDAKFNFSGSPEITIVKLVNGVDTHTATYNETVTFRLNITNTDDVNLTNITVVDLLPADITWADAATPVEDSVILNANGTTTIVWQTNLTPFEPLQPGHSFEIQFNATVNEGAECGKTYRNWATVNATSDWGDVSDTDYADVYLECLPRVPVLMPFGIAALIGLLSLVIALSTRKKQEKRGK